MPQINESITINADPLRLGRSPAIRRPSPNGFP